MFPEVHGALSIRFEEHEITMRLGRIDLNEYDVIDSNGLEHRLSAKPLTLLRTML